MGKKYNVKYTKCTICDKKHYALGYCRKHWTNQWAGRTLERPICKAENCTKRVTKYLEYQLCAKHYGYYYRKYINPKQTRDGGKWGYKNRALYIKHRKPYCEWCGVQGKRGNVRWTLEMHHLDGNSRNSELSNLVTICQKCHRIHHLSGKNKKGNI